jgi:hypothetical protein
MEPWWWPARSLERNEPVAGKEEMVTDAVGDSRRKDFWEKSEVEKTGVEVLAGVLDVVWCSAAELTRRFWWRSDFVATAV